ncbi:MAG TPA: hypothetical protein VF468_19665, partial [Actinomycetota bacterium]|nr:hypothetical protein [Actinomycetota bacterium]
MPKRSSARAKAATASGATERPTGTRPGSRARRTNPPTPDGPNDSTPSARRPSSAGRQVPPFGGQEPLGRQHPVDGEGAPVADPLAQPGPDPAGQVA